MTRPLQFGDPGELGPFRLEARLHESAAGIVYRGSDSQGRPVEVALLTTAAAGDPAARDRFRAAVAAESGTAAREGAAPVVAALAEGGAPWVATAHLEGRDGAERFLRPVLLERGWGARRRRGGPQFQPYWLSGPRGPALRVEEPPVAAPGERAGDTKALAAAVGTLMALLVLLALLLLLLFKCEPSDPVPRPTDAPASAPATRESPPRPTPVTPTPGRTGTRSPRPTPTGSAGTVNPASRGG